MARVGPGGGVQDAAASVRAFASHRRAVVLGGERGEKEEKEAGLEPASFPTKSRCDSNHTLRPQTTCLNQPIQGSSFSFSHFLFFSLSLFLAFSLSGFLAFSITRARTLSLPTPTPPHPLLLSYTNSVSLTPYPLALTLSSTLSLSQPILVHCRSGGRARGAQERQRPCLAPPRQPQPIKTCDAAPSLGTRCVCVRASWSVYGNASRSM